MAIANSFLGSVGLSRFGFSLTEGGLVYPGPDGQPLNLTSTPDVFNQMVTATFTDADLRLTEQQQFATTGSRVAELQDGKVLYRNWHDARYAAQLVGINDREQTRDVRIERVLRPRKGLPDTRLIVSRSTRPHLDLGPVISVRQVQRVLDTGSLPVQTYVNMDVTTALQYTKKVDDVMPILEAKAATPQQNRAELAAAWQDFNALGALFRSLAQPQSGTGALVIDVNALKTLPQFELPPEPVVTCDGDGLGFIPQADVEKMVNFTVVFEVAKRILLSLDPTDSGHKKILRGGLVFVEPVTDKVLGTMQRRGNAVTLDIPEEKLLNKIGGSQCVLRSRVRSDLYADTDEPSMPLIKVGMDIRGLRVDFSPSMKHSITAIPEITLLISASLFRLMVIEIQIEGSDSGQYSHLQAKDFA